MTVIDMARALARKRRRRWQFCHVCGRATWWVVRAETDPRLIFAIGPHDTWFCTEHPGG
jgi:hypothetical protein